MKKIAFVFPGQGSQYVGMSRSFNDASEKARAVFEAAAEVLGEKFVDTVFNGPREELDRTEITQPALLAASIAAFEALAERLGGKAPSAAFMAGHSLGEYTALVASGSLDLKEALRLVNLRGRFMQEAVPPGTGRMSAIIGLDTDTIERICRSASMNAAEVAPANINSPGQVVISGHAAAVGIAEKYAKDEGAKRVIPLAVSVPSHSPLMFAAAERLAKELKGIDFNAPAPPVVSNVEAAPVTEAAEIPRLLKDQLTSPVRWVETVLTLEKEGVEATVEVGPGKVLSGLVKRTAKDMKTLNLDNAGDLDGLVEALGEA